jgi:hypothetical protein
MRPRYRNRRHAWTARQQAHAEEGLGLARLHQHLPVARAAAAAWGPSSRQRAASVAAAMCRRARPACAQPRPSPEPRHPRQSPPAARALPARRYLRGKNLKGSIPDDPLWFDLYGLKNIDMSDNPNLVGTIPQVLSGLTSIQAM